MKLWFRDQNTWRTLSSDVEEVINGFRELCLVPSLSQKEMYQQLCNLQDKCRCYGFLCAIGAQQARRLLSKYSIRDKIMDNVWHHLSQTL